MRKTKLFDRADEVVIDWALQRGYPCVYAHVAPMRTRCLRIAMDHATAFFQHGRIVNLKCRDDGCHTDEMAYELADLFGLCGYLEMTQPADHDASPVCHSA